MQKITYRNLVGLLIACVGMLGLTGCADDDDNGYDNILDVECTDTAIIYTSMDFFYTPRPAELREQIYNRENEFEKLDIDSDGFLSITEYNGTRQLFEDMDTNWDEQLSREETKYMITFADIPSGNKYISAAFLDLFYKKFYKCRFP